MQKTDWTQHIAEFESSGKKTAEYCQAVGLNLGTFRHHLYKSREKSRSKLPGPSFKELSVANELTVSVGTGGDLSLHGITRELLPAVLRAWADALPK